MQRYSKEIMYDDHIKAWRWQRRDGSTPKIETEPITTMKKSPGQIDYEADVRARPTYPDKSPRKTWDELPDHARKSWEQEE